MKFQSMLIFCLFVIDASANQGKLTFEENKNRLDKCGKTSFEPPSQLLSWIHINDKLFSAATLLSPRHLLTSAHLVFKQTGPDDNPVRKWIHNNIIIDFKNCGKVKLHIPVPKEALGRLYNGWNLREKSVNFVSATIFCDEPTSYHTGFMFLPMIVEIDSDYQLSFPCLPEEEPVLRKNESLQVFGFRLNGSHPLFWEAQTKWDYTHNSTSFYKTEVYKHQAHAGGPLVKNEQNRRIMIGLDAKGYWHDPNATNPWHPWFFKMSWMAEDLCDVAGICSRKLSPIIVTEKPTTVPSPTEKPTTVPPTTEKPIVIPPAETDPPTPTEAEISATPPESTTEAPTKPTESKPQNITPKVSTLPSVPLTRTSPEERLDIGWTPMDVDADYEEFLERNKGMDKADDLDNDFFVERDFLNGVQKTWNFLIFLMVVLVLIQ